MIKGIGIDTVDITEIQRFIEQFGDVFLNRTFTEEEVRQAKQKGKQAAEYLAARFAVKEAVFKAVAPSTESKKFDFRIVETRNHEDGSPYVHINDDLQAVLDEAGVDILHLSITTETQYASAFVIAETQSN